MGEGGVEVRGEELCMDVMLPWLEGATEVATLHSGNPVTYARP